MNDQLTELEKIHLEHWSRRRISVFKKCVLLYGILFGGFMSAIMLRDLYINENMPIYIVAALSIFTFIISALMGAVMWLFWDMRFRRLQKRASRPGT